jgi:hypothetical protein
LEFSTGGRRGINLQDAKSGNLACLDGAACVVMNINAQKTTIRIKVEVQSTPNSGD